MNTTTERIARIAELEWANYAATSATARVTPGLDVVLRDDVIITSSEAFPSPDANHACLLRATSQTVDSLIAEVTDYFKSKDLLPTLFISPACTPADLPERLLGWGFVKQRTEEAWVVLDLLDFQIPALSHKVVIRRVAQDQALAFAEIFMAAFDLPSDFAPYMAQLLEPSLSLPGVRHYIALIDGQPVGTCSLIRHKNFGILGSAGVLLEHRKSGAATNLAIKAVTEAREQGIDTVMAQTMAGTWLERLLCISGFKRVFTRTCYTLP
ncbi:MAG: GNAT family N-acetyltransferase [Chloroflexota bacterium]|nr:GNAT family N-acetyltransferase [Chloroflexota bacterium]